MTKWTCEVHQDSNPSWAVINTGLSDEYFSCEMVINLSTM